MGDGGGLVLGRPPAEKVEEIVGITTQGGIGYAPDSLLVQVSIDPLHSSTGLLDHAKRAVGVAQPELVSYTEYHREASCNRR
jgi:hypothetical protein